MKTLAPNEMVELLPLDDAELSAALRKFELAAPVLARDAGYCKTLFDEGWINAAQVTHQGKPSHLVGWHLSPDGGFWFDVVLALEHPLPHDELIGVVEGFARAARAKYIRWTTLRRGIVRWAQDHGYTPEAVILTKLL